MFLPKDKNVIFGIRNNYAAYTRYKSDHARMGFFDTGCSDVRRRAAPYGAVQHHKAP